LINHITAFFNTEGITDQERDCVMKIVAVAATFGDTPAAHVVVACAPAPRQKRKILSPAPSAPTRAFKRSLHQVMTEAKRSMTVEAVVQILTAPDSAYQQFLPVPQTRTAAWVKRVFSQNTATYRNLQNGSFILATLVS